LALRIAGSPSPSKPTQRIAQRQQIGGAKGGSARRDQAELVCRVYIGESACDRAKPPVVTGEHYPVLAPMTAPADYLEHMTVQRMKRVGDPHLQAGRADTLRS
jgi:hypothetical protein